MQQELTALSLRMICEFALGDADTDADRVAAAFEEVLTEHLRRLPNFGMVLKESMRLFPPGPYGARETTEDLLVGPYEIPAGTTVFYPFRAVHLNPRYWPDPERFDPERFTPRETAGRAPALRRPVSASRAPGRHGSGRS
ncbi:cytochrome P450 [Streptomyces naphthomycinicus]|uniref:cytochrome P450 n=1 Tax=Streptomyces naphthomycinicus TaxID=2872625 RepID=UPI0027E4081C|nr:cytochrome P450 [Streptomyces sp. TML10]